MANGCNGWNWEEETKKIDKKKYVNSKIFFPSYFFLMKYQPVLIYNPKHINTLKIVFNIVKLIN
jgi:hypothetical protein